VAFLLGRGRASFLVEMANVANAANVTNAANVPPANLANAANVASAANVADGDDCGQCSVPLGCGPAAAGRRRACLACFIWH
jgi:hypothetical protein